MSKGCWPRAFSLAIYLINMNAKSYFKEGKYIFIDRCRSSGHDPYIATEDLSNILKHKSVVESLSEGLIVSQVVLLCL
jgi:hypothetical protein